VSAIFVIGSGPSLLKQQSMLKDLETTFCCNRFEQWEARDFTPTYYICNASVVSRGLEPTHPPFRREKFLVSARKDKLNWFEGWHSVYKQRDHDLLLPGHEGLLTVKSGASMAAIMAQVAVWLGYNELYFLGIEQRGRGHVFDLKGEGTVFLASADDALFGIWQSIKDTYEGLGVKLRDCTPDGRLNDILEYVPLEEVLGTE
tara:strand:- start:9987 stop:10592 length:606 start_codon:yes stop_codon:yes gene_type:complete